MGHRHDRLLACTVSGLLVLAHAFLQGATTPSYIFENTTAPKTANIENTPITSAQRYNSVEDQVAQEPSVFPKVAAWSLEQDPFIRDTRLDINFRTYFLNADGGIPGTEREAWAAGGGLVYKSGYWKDILAIGAAGYTTQPVYAPSWGDGTKLLGPGQSGFSVLGTAYAEIKVKKVNGRFYRQIIDTPYLNQHDNRMIPNTFEAYIIGSQELEPVQFIAGQVTKVKPKDFNHFITVAEGLGVINNDTNGITMGGFRANISEHVIGGMINYYVWDIANVYYAEIDADVPLGDPWSLSLGFQFSDQRSIGEELLGDTSSQQVGATTSVGYSGAVLSLSCSSLLTNDGLLSPYGSYPGFTSLIIEDFNRARQTSFVIGLSYDFGEIGLHGLSAFTNYGYAFADHTSITGVPPRSDEFDITIDYRFKEGLLKNLWIRLRGAWVGFDDPAGGPYYNSINDYRIIVNYDIPLL